MRGTFAILACAVLVLLPALLLMTGCSKSRSPSVGGETNWLRQCSADDRCEMGSCMCGVCTVACSEDDRCAGEFRGACTGTDDGAGAALCETSASPPAEAVCLPRCSSNAACGGGYRCEHGVCVPVRPNASEPDGSIPTIGPILDELARSEATWRSLVSENAPVYWYTEENCAPNGAREGTVVQVDGDVAENIGSYTVIDCPAVFVNRYESFTARPIDQLYDDCEQWVRRDGELVRIGFDAQNVIEHCVAPDEPGCFDNCGEGFALGRWAFGLAPEQLDAGIIVPAPDAGDP